MTTAAAVKPTARGGGGRASDTQSQFSMNSVRTVDRERLRDRARQLQMKDNARLMLCARLQQTLRKSPKVAEELAGEILRRLQQRGAGLDISDDDLATLVQELSAVRQQQKQLALASLARGESGNDTPEQGAGGGSKPQYSGRRSSSSSKDKQRSGRGNGGRLGKGPGPSSAVAHTQRSVAAASNNADAVGEDVYLTQSQLQQLSTGFRLPPRASPKKDKGNGIWEEIVKFSSVEEKLEAQRIREARERARRQLSSKLAEQVQGHEQQREAERRAANEFYHETKQRLQQQEDEERQKEAQRLEMAKQLTRVQDEQRLAKQQQLARERQLKELQEKKLADNLKRQMEDERERERQRKESEKQRILRVLHENEEDMRRKQAQKDKEREYELKLAEEYIKMEEAKEAGRKKQLEDMANNVKARMKFFGDTAKAEMDARAQEEEARVRKYQEDYDRKQIEAERKKREEAERRSLAQQEFLRRQMLEKREREQATKQDLNKQAEIWKQERLEAERREKLQKQQRALRNLSQQELLLEQMREKEQRSLQADQSTLEVQLNAKLLEKIHKQVGNGATVVSETQNRSRELQQREDKIFQARQQKL